LPAFCPETKIPGASKKNVFVIHLAMGLVETDMNGNGSHPAMKNCEGSTGTRNGLLRGQRSFQLIEAPRGRPFGGGAGHRNGGPGMG